MRGKHDQKQCYILATAILQGLRVGPSARLLHMRQASLKSWLQALVSMYWHWFKSKRKAMNRNWCNQKANPALNTKAGNK